MQIYGIGGQDVQGDASEAMAEIAQNRTLMVEKLTHDAPIKPEIVEGLKNIDEVFEHFQPEIDVDFEDSEGAGREEKLRFNGLSDFSIKGITAQSEFLQDLTIQKEQYQKVIKQLKSNKLLKKALDNPETKEALLNAMYSMIKEISDNK